MRRCAHIQECAPFQRKHIVKLIDHAVVKQTNAIQQPPVGLRRVKGINSVFKRSKCDTGGYFLPITHYGFVIFCCVAPQNLL